MSKPMALFRKGLYDVYSFASGVIVFQDHWMREVEPENNSNE